MWPFKSKPKPEPHVGPTMSSEALDYQHELLDEFGRRMGRVFDWTDRVEESDVKKAFIEVCQEMTMELEMYFSSDSEEHITFILERSIIPFWKEYDMIVPEAVDYISTIPQDTLASIAYKLGATKSLTIGESANLMNAIISLREDRPRPAPIDLDIPKFPVVQEELRGRTYLRIPRSTNE